MLSMASCSEIKDGVNDMDSWEEIVTPQVYTINHPAMLHSSEDINYVRQNLTRAPWKDAWDVLVANPYSDVNRAANPTKLISRTNGNAECPNNAVNFGRDCAGIYQLALRYALTDDVDAANRAISNVMAWVEKSEGIHHNNDTNQQLILFQIYQMANGMELLRSYNNWGESEDFKKACNWLIDKFYPQATDFLARPINTSDHYWVKWELGSMTANLSIGILTDNQDMSN